MSKYSKKNNRCLQKAAEDEPLFVLRATDRTAPGLIRVWCILAAEKAERDEMGMISLPMREKLADAENAAQEMERWPRRKYPD